MNIDELINNNRFTIILGKNGSGKSTLLREINASKRNITKYISPERGGTLRYDPNIDTTISNNPGWLYDTRHKNRFEQFREQSATQFRNLETMILREIEKDQTKRQDLSYTFDTILNKINILLPAIQLKRSDKGFEIYDKIGNKINEDNISSGESELIALSIEVLVYSRESIDNKLLLLDEPDVHLHPDLQTSFIKFIENLAIETNFKIIIATHSTAIIGSFSNKENIQIVPIKNKTTRDFDCFNYSQITHQILPIFGAHPLSSVFCESPIILVEGDDDSRIIEQITRSSEGNLKLSPCVVGSVDEMNRWELWLNNFLPSIYDNPIAYSLRDLDQSSQTEIDDNGIIRRLRLNCYAVENILLTTNCFSKLNTSEADFIRRIRTWSETFPDHKYVGEVKSFIEQFPNRRTLKIKNIRNIIIAILEFSKPWEVLVGQLVFECIVNKENRESNNVREYLGEKAFNILTGIHT